MTEKKISSNQEKVWFLKDDPSRRALCIEEVILLWQKGHIKPYTILWNEGEQAWLPLSQCKEIIDQKYMHLWIRRESPRYQVDIPCLITNQFNIWEGRIKSISSNGAFIQCDHRQFYEGDLISVIMTTQFNDAHRDEPNRENRISEALSSKGFVHTDFFEGFQINGEIISRKNYSTKVHFTAKSHYFLRFLPMKDKDKLFDRLGGKDESYFIYK